MGASQPVHCGTSRCNVCTEDEGATCSTQPCDKRIDHMLEAVGDMPVIHNFDHFVSGGKNTGKVDGQKDQAMVNHMLLRAAEEGNILEMEKLLANGAMPDTRQPYFITPKAHKENASPFRAKGMTPLMYCAQAGNLEATKLLLDANASLTQEDEDGMRPLHFAAQAGSYDVCQFLMDRGADPHAEDDWGCVALLMVPREILKSKKNREKWQQLFQADGSCDVFLESGDTRDLKPARQPPRGEDAAAVSNV